MSLTSKQQQFVAEQRAYNEAWKGTNTAASTEQWLAIYDTLAEARADVLPPGTLAMLRTDIHGLVSYAIAGPSNDASREVRDRLLARVRAILAERQP